MFAFFVDRPVLAGVISVLITVIGVVAGLALPIAQFPEIAPPTVLVEATYPGASADQTYKAVTLPLEQEINGAQDLIYIQSTSNTDGSVSLNATFKIGSNLDAAAADVLTRANRAEARLPQAVRDQGLTIQKATRQQLGNVVLTGDGDRFDELFLSNWAETQVIKPLKRVEGMGRVLNFSQMRYAMRIWLDPVKMEALRIGTDAVVTAVNQQNAQITTGSLGKQPTTGKAPPFELQIVTKGRLSQPEEFANIVLRADPDGSVVRVRDVGRVELGSEQYGVNSTYDGKAAVTVALYQVPGANAIKVMDGVRATMKDLATRFPDGLRYEIALDQTVFVKKAIEEVVITLGEAILLVVAVTYLFLQNWRATLIPSIAVPVALIGTFGPMAALGFSFNTLSLLGLVLAVGLVVDDAIIVVENTERLLGEGLAPKDAARTAINEIAGPVIATTLVLVALFVPVAFVPGITGQLYNQFALTIAISVMISAIVSLTLTPALCGLLLRPHAADHDKRRWWRAPLRWFETSLQRASVGLGTSLGFLARHLVALTLVFVALSVITVLVVRARPTGFVPNEDQGYFYVDIGMPKGSSVERTQHAVERIGAAVRERAEIDHTIDVIGRSVLSDAVAPFYGFLTPTLKPWDERKVTADESIAAISKRFANDPDATLTVVPPPPIPGLGAFGGLTLEVQDRTGEGGTRLAGAAEALADKLRTLPSIGVAEPTTSYGVPQIHLAIDRAKAEQLGVPVQNLFDALGTYVGSTFVNLFNRFGFVYQVYVQSEARGRQTLKQIEALPVMNRTGDAVRVGSLVRASFESGPTAVLSYNTYPAIEMSIQPAAGYSSGQVIADVEKLAAQALPSDFSTEWTDIAYQEKISGSYAPLIFAFGVLMIFLLLAGQYESLRLPFVVLIVTPMAILGAVGALALRGLALDVFGQIGLLLLVGLAAKNSILLVTFAEEQRRGGADALEAATQAARLRMRPILMTSFAFILGSLPLAIAGGAGANARVSMGTVVIGGLLVATLLTLFLTPSFYVAAERLLRRDRKHGAQEAPLAAE